MTKRNKDLATTEPGLPAELAAQFAEDAKENLKNVEQAYFRISVKGGKFKVDGVKIGKDGRGEEFSAIILKEIPVNTFNKTAYKEGETSVPECWSLGGYKPAPGCEEPQAATCASCPQNRFGSAVDKNTGEAGKGKACSNSRRLILKIDGYDMPVLLQIPPTSRKNLDSYLKQLSAGEQKVPMFALHTHFQMSEDFDYPVVEMSREGFLTAEQYQEIKEFRQSDIVTAALNAYAQHEESEPGDSEKF